MAKGMTASAMLHAALIGAAVVSFSSPSPAPDSQPPVPVDLISPSEFSKLMAGSRAGKADAKAAEKPAPKPAKQPPPPAPKPAPTPAPSKVAAAAPPPPTPAPAPEPPKPEVKPEPAPEPSKPAEIVPEKAPDAPKAAEAPKPDAPKPEPKQAEAPKPKPPKPQPDRIAELLKAQPDAPKAEKKPRTFDPDRIAALLNKQPDAGGKPDAAPSKSRAAPAAAEPAALGAPEGRDASMSANEIDAFRAAISRCWAPPVGGLGAESIAVKLRLRFNADGSLARPPEVASGSSAPGFPAAADAAARAVLQCQPYAMLPREKFAQWGDMMLNFDPREMNGG